MDQAVTQVETAGDMPAISSRTMAAMDDQTILDVRNLTTELAAYGARARPVNGVSLSLKRGRTLSIVGESGSGKSVTALSIMRLISTPAMRTSAGQVLLEGRDLLKLSQQEMNGVRGNEIAMIFQEPMTSLNPVLTIGYQIAEVLRRHQHLSKSAAAAKAIELLSLVRIPEPARRVREYPHQLSGGMRQRAMIAMALSCNPKILIADEPTTALDVTIQAQVLELIGDLQRRLGTSVLLITHDLGVVAETSDDVIVMYAGRKVEEAPVRELFANPAHPYTRGLLKSMPKLRSSTTDVGAKRPRLVEISGIVPPITDLPVGCSFAPRCPLAEEACTLRQPDYEQVDKDHWVACWKWPAALGNAS
jgi:peptide/nickel transport system ATP-binding protein